MAAAPNVARALLDHPNPDDQTIARDRERLRLGARARAAAAQDYFRAHAAEWDRIRKLHVADDCGGRGDPQGAAPTSRSARCSISAPAPAACSNCSGRRSSGGLGLDLSLDMLLLPRATCWSAAGSVALQRASGRSLRPRRSANDHFDVIILHQVLYFLEDGGARHPRGGARAAARRRCWSLDFAPHEQEFLREQFAHLPPRLRARETVTQWIVAVRPRSR